MKKYLLSLLIVPLLLIGCYSSASFMQDFSISPSVCLQGDKKNYRWDISENGLSAGDYNLIDLNSNNSLDEIYLSSNVFGNKSYYGNSFTVTDDFFTAGGRITFYYYCSDLPIINGKRTLTFKVVSSDYKPPLVNGGTANFTPIITGLTGSINEFIPYVVYICLGVLGVFISFVAVKRLINWVRVKIFSSFKR